mmetsp:Transcript_10172/g.24475  ORF Transcript_10172/g.24475 Transcript_10172/m.24475 type:complete len:475 (+) Transcript_10172:254-1678(+)|eukprot:CAMPEP_0113471724 /NCGR_PEP_ID=MMETSP0014_2-20120614/17129_1 /TAXON_ID=2857 /ORGANISM="Nitzschia sp." /LENGTH=474 /DNA_ID=CAMNT_0000364375 /DNA_START=199 /DNA_END=1623 /DNA_ORIENTATION=- /assembly_acc=CAM_ASM_000159
MAAALDNMNMDMMLFDDEHDNNHHVVDHHVAHVTHTAGMMMSGEDALLHLSDIVNLDEMFADVMTSTTAAEQHQQQQQHEREEFNHAFPSFSVPSGMDDVMVPFVSPAATSSGMEMMMTAVPMTLPGLTVDDGFNGAIVPIAPRTTTLAPMATATAETGRTKSMITSRLAASLNRTANNVSPTPSSEGLLLAAANGKKKTPTNKKRKSPAGAATATKKKRVKTTTTAKKAPVSPATAPSIHQLLLPRPTPASTFSSSVSVSSSSSSSIPSEVDNQSTKSIKKTKKVETDDQSTAGASASSGSSITADVDADLALKERNRVHAKASRQRRKSLTEDLHSQMQKLKEENEVLRKFILSRIDAKKRTKQQQSTPQSSSTTTRHELDEIVSKKRTEPTLRFLEQFKSDPRNRKVNAKQIRFLHGLRRHLPTATNANNNGSSDNVKPAPQAANQPPSPDTNKSYSDDSSPFDTHFAVVA